MDERLVQLSITLGGYSDGTWHVALVKSTYEHGRLEACGIVAQRVLTEDQVLDHLTRAMKHVMDIEDARRGLTGRARRSHSSGEL